MEVAGLKCLLLCIQFITCRVVTPLEITQLQLLIFAAILLGGLELRLALLLVAVQGILSVVLNPTKFALEGPKQREKS